jgi:hypothetical protein
MKGLRYQGAEKGMEIKYAAAKALICAIAY